MASIVDKLGKTGKLNCPSFVLHTQYEAIHGSRAYATNSPESDYDIYGFCFPSKDIAFPNSVGFIYGFDDNKAPKFQNYQHHHIMLNDKEYGVDIYNVIDYFRLLTENNPNIVDSLFVSQENIIHATRLGQMVRDNRKIFLHKGSYHKFRGYAHSQLNKAKNKNPIGKRYDSFIKYGFDLKFAANIVRLADECEQILTFGDIDLHRSKEMQKAIRRGEMPMSEIEAWFYSKETTLEKLYNESTAIPYSAPIDKIKCLLLNLLEEYYGTIDIAKSNDSQNIANDIKKILNNYGY